MGVLKRVGWLALTLLAPCAFVVLQLVAAVAFSIEAAVAASGDATAAEELYMGSLSSVLLMAQVMTLAVAYPWWRLLKRRRRVARSAAGGEACEECVAGEVEVLSYSGGGELGAYELDGAGQPADQVEKSICSAPGGQAVHESASALNEAAQSAVSAGLPQAGPSYGAAPSGPAPAPALVPVPVPGQGSSQQPASAPAAAAYVLPDEFSPRPVSPRNKTGLVMLGLGVQLTVSVALSVVFALLPHLEQEYAEVMNSGDLGTVALLPILATALGAPVVEEVLCRGVAFACARRALPRVWMANVLQALLFAVLHGNITQGAYAFAIGLVLGGVWLRYRRLGCCIAVHFAVNASSYVMDLLPFSLPALMAAGVALLVAGWVWAGMGERGQAAWQVQAS